MKITEMIEGAGKLKDAMQAGKEVKNPASWKEAQVTGSRVFYILALIIFGLKMAGVELPLTDEQIVVISGAIATVLGVINEVITTVSSKKIGATK